VVVAVETNFDLPRSGDRLRGASHGGARARCRCDLSLVLGTTLALGIRHLPRRAAFAVYAVLVLAIAFPAAALGDALWLGFSIPFRDFPFGEFGWFGTRAQTVGLATLEVPFVVLIVSARLASIPFEQEEMAADLGAPPSGVIGRVLVPQVLPAIGGAAMVGFTIGMGEFVITDALRSTDDTRTLASSFFGRDPSRRSTRSPRPSSWRGSPRRPSSSRPSDSAGAAGRDTQEHDRVDPWATVRLGRHRSRRTAPMRTEARATRQESNAYELFILVLTVLSLVFMVGLVLPRLDPATESLLRTTTTRSAWSS
jgi:ABC-type molybdate transport system permease subunit